MLPSLPIAERECPDHVARAMAAVTPSARLLHVAGPLWWLLWHLPNAGRARTGWNLARRELAKPAWLIDWTVVKQGRVMMDGWQHLGDVEVWGEIPTDQVVRDLQYKLTRTETEIEAAFAVAEHAASGGAEADRHRAVRREYLGLEGKSLWKHMKRHDT